MDIYGKAIVTRIWLVGTALLLTGLLVFATGATVLAEPVGGVITTVAGGYLGEGVPATSASLRSPSGVAVDSQGNIFIADASNNRIRRVDVSTGVITTVAGNGTLVVSPFNYVGIDS